MFLLLEPESPVVTCRFVVLGTISVCRCFSLYLLGQFRFVFHRSNFSYRYICIIYIYTYIYIHTYKHAILILIFMHTCYIYILHLTSTSLLRTSFLETKSLPHVTTCDLHVLPPKNTCGVIVTHHTWLRYHRCHEAMRELRQAEGRRL